MLSNVELILLSLINEKPSYAYEIEKQIETKKMRHWVKIGIASIYQVLERLRKQGLVSFKTEKEGRAPERKRFFITEEGQEKLRESVQHLLSHAENYYLDLNVAIECADILDRETYRQCLTQRLEQVETALQRVKSMLEVNDQDTTSKGAMVMQNLLLFRKAERDFLKSLLENI
ncbi:MAG: PadR family transcriptional regulator [Desulfitobacterium hafniense]|nr:PadR family transcriptional regulator [Desulfitobacterium hafniense]